MDMVMVRLWTEDDASRAAGDESREQVEGAWERLFGESIPPRTGWRLVEDWGDAMLYEPAPDRFVVYSFDGYSIHRAPTPEERAEE